MPTVLRNGPYRFYFYSHEPHEPPHVHVENFWSPGMTGSDPKPGDRVKAVRLGDDEFSVDLLDGRTITVPYAWYPRLLHATPEQRGNWKISGGGYGIHWPEIDEDLSTEGLLRGSPAPRAAASK